MKKTTSFLTLIIYLYILSGCNQSEAEQESRISLIQTTNPSPVQLTDKKEGNIVENIKDDVKDFDEIYDVAVVKGKKDTIVVYKVKHLKRFRMKTIEKKITKLLEKKYSDEKFTVSSDYKIFMEALELKEKVENNHLSDDKAEKELQKIIQLKEERT